MIIVMSIQKKTKQIALFRSIKKNLWTDFILFVGIMPHCRYNKNGNNIVF